MKLFKRLTAGITATVLALTLAGCTKEETDFANILKNIANEDGLSYNGNVSFNYEVPENLGYLGYMVPDADELSPFHYLKDISVSYDLEYIKSKGEAKGTFVDAKTGDRIMSFTLKDKEVIAEVSGIVKLITTNLSTDRTKSLSESIKRETVERNFSNLQYVKMTLPDLYEYMEIDENSEEGKAIKDIFTLKAFDNGKVINDMFYDDIILGVFKDFDSQVVTYENGKYTIKIDSKNAVKLAERIAIYSIDHSDEFGIAIKNIIDITPFDAGQYDYLYDTEAEYKQSLKDEVSALVLKVNSDKEGYKKMVTDTLNSENVGIAAVGALLDGTSLNTGTKSENGTISGETHFSLNTKTALFNPAKLKLNISETFKIKPIKEISFKFPNADQIRSFKELTKLKLDAPKAMILESDFISYAEADAEYLKQLDIEGSEDAFVDTADGFHTSASVTIYDGLTEDYDYPDILVFENNPYMNTVSFGEAFNETLVWDDAKKQLYIFDNTSQRVYVNGKTKEGKYYVDINDLPALGYEVTKVEAKANAKPSLYSYGRGDSSKIIIYKK